MNESWADRQHERSIEQRRELREPKTTRLADAVWYILMKHAGAQEGLRDAFRFTWAGPTRVEFRFMGLFGFGGKIWRNGVTAPFVSYYPEDKTPEREAAREETNAALQRLYNLYKQPE
jgi:hypothetical protein